MSLDQENVLDFSMIGLDLSFRLEMQQLFFSINSFLAHKVGAKPVLCDLFR